MTDKPYEAPSVEEIGSGEYPISTAAGQSLPELD
jgi:hypothetical protein